MSSLIIAMITCTYLSVPIQSQSVETLFHSAISSAQCQAKCLSSATPEDRQDCLTICPIVQSNPSSSLCRYPTLCTGGCQTACQRPAKTDSVHQDSKLSSLVQQSCQLTWKMKQNEKENVVFVVAGKDQVGMWNLMFNKITERRVELTELMTAKFVEITVLAVDSQEVLDKTTVKIEHAKCEEKIEEFEEITVEERNEPTSVSIASLTGETLHFISFVILMIILIIILCIITIMKRSDKQLSMDDSLGRITKDAFLTTKDDFEFDDVECNKQIYKFF